MNVILILTRAVRENKNAWDCEGVDHLIKYVGDNKRIIESMTTAPFGYISCGIRTPGFWRELHQKWQVVCNTPESELPKIDNTIINLFEI